MEKGFIAPLKVFPHNTLRRSTGTRRDALDPAAERRLVAEARRGDRRALEIITRRISGSLYRFGRGFCRDPHDAEDVMQEVLLALVSSLPRFRGDASLSSWAYVVARNACARRRKRGARHQSLESATDGSGLEIRDPGSTPDRAAERRELREALEHGIAQLPASLRDVLVLRDVEGLSAAQVGKRLGLGERAVKSRLHRARLALRERLAPHLATDVPPRGPDCPEVEQFFSRSLEGDLDARTCRSLEEHVSGCTRCTAACVSLRAALGACAAWRSAPIPPRVHAAVRAALRKVIAERGSTSRSRPSRRSLPGPMPV